MPIRSHTPRRTAVAGFIAVAMAVVLSSCATPGPKQSAPDPTSSSPTSSSSPSTTSAAPTTTAEPTPANQPAVVYTKSQDVSAVGEPVNVTIRVETPNPAIPFGDVTLIVDGVAHSSATLDAEGNATFTLTDLAPGEHTYQGTFAGNLEYVAAESVTKSLNVKTAEQIAAEKKAKEEAEQKAKEEAEKKKQAEAAAAASGNPCPVSARACIDLTNNKTWIQEDGQIVYGPVPQIAGREGHRTPPGTFTVGWKNIDHKSSEFDDAPMPYAIFFNGGIAFHEGSLSNPSHGCIHLSHSAAAAYWDLLSVGDTVYVYGKATTY